MRLFVHEGRWETLLVLSRAANPMGRCVLRRSARQRLGPSDSRADRACLSALFFGKAVFHLLARLRSAAVATLLTNTVSQLSRVSSTRKDTKSSFDGIDSTMQPFSLCLVIAHVLGLANASFALTDHQAESHPHCHGDTCSAGCRCGCSGGHVCMLLTCPHGAAA